MAFARSLNTVASELSFAVGREKVIEMTERLGISGVKKTCSMALGDGGITLVEHVGGVATFANGGKLAKAYGILDITNSKGEVVYSRERDEPPAPQVVSQRVAEQMNQIMEKVVSEGTGKPAALDFTISAGKTGTSTGPKDAWFAGFTGKYAAVVWIGNDDNKPMNGVTGGHNAAPIWHNFMAVAHTDMNIPQLPGLPLHPVQQAEVARLAAVREAQAAAGILTEETTGPDGTRRRAKLMPDRTRDALAKLAGALRKAGGLPEPAAAPEPNGTAPANKPAAPPGVPGTPAPAERAQVQRNIQTGSTGKAPARPAGAAAGGTARGAQ
jgi:penicillin-binding protein 1A